MFGKQAFRLLRETWRNATLLAEELYAMFQDNIPLEHAAPVTINNTSNSLPPLTLAGQGDNILNITNPAGETTGGFVTNNDNSVTVNAPGGINGPATNITNITEFLTQYGPQITQYIQNSLPSSAGGGIPVRVVSGSGIGPYSIVAYPEGLSGASINAQATVLQIDGSETIPANTWLNASLVGGIYYIQPAIWL